MNERTDQVMDCGCNPAERTGGGHDPACPEFDPECTCYEFHGGHQSGCPRKHWKTGIDHATEGSDETVVTLHDGERVRNITPRNDNILVQLEQPWAEYTGPLVLPDDIDPDKHDIRIAKVLAVGPGDYGERGLKRDRVRIPIDVGQRVLIDQLPTHGWWPTIAPGVHMIPWRQVLGIVEEPSEQWEGPVKDPWVDAWCYRCISAEGETLREIFLRGKDYPKPPTAEEVGANPSAFEGVKGPD